MGPLDRFLAFGRIDPWVYVFEVPANRHITFEMYDFLGLGGLRELERIRSISAKLTMINAKSGRCEL